VVFRNSAESKFKALALGICEGMWKQRLLRGLGVELVNPIKKLCDNQATKSIAKNPIHHERAKHIEID